MLMEKVAKTRTRTEHMQTSQMTSKEKWRSNPKRTKAQKRVRDGSCWINLQFELKRSTSGTRHAHDAGSTVSTISTARIEFKTKLPETFFCFFFLFFLVLIKQNDGRVFVGLSWCWTKNGGSRGGKKLKEKKTNVAESERVILDSQKNRKCHALTKKCFTSSQARLEFENECKLLTSWKVLNNNNKNNNTAAT